MFGFLLQREAIVATAVIGGVLALVGSAMARRGDPSPPLARTIILIGYVVSAASLILFTVAGFLSAD